MLRTKYILFITIILLPLIALSACTTRTQLDGKTDKPAAPNEDFRSDTPTIIANTGRPQLVEIYADWWSACRSAKPMVHGLESDYWGKVDFVYLDIENPNNNQPLRSRFGNVNSVPRFYVLAPDGSIVSQWVGVDSAGNMRQKLDFVVQNYPPTVARSEPLDQAYQQINHSLWWMYFILSYLY